MTMDNNMRNNWIQNLSILREKIVNVIEKSREQAKVLNNFREEQQLITARSIPMATYGRLAYITLAIMFMVVALFGGQWIPLLMIAAGLGSYIFALYKGKAVKFLSYALMVIGMVTLAFGMSRNISTFIILLIVYLLIVAAEIGIAALINANRNKNNADIRVHNSQNQIAYDQVAREFAYLQDDLLQFANAINYPPDYMSIDAVDYFVNAVRNFRADSYKELINLYIDELRYRAQVEHWAVQESELASIRNEMEINNALTRENNAQLRRLNAISVASMIQNAANAATITGAINNNTGAVYQNVRATKDVEKAVNYQTDVMLGRKHYL